MNLLTRAAATAVCVASLFCSAEPSIKTERVGGLKGKTSVALAAFRVIFVTEDSVAATSSNNFGGGGMFSAGRATSQQDAELLGLTKPLMQTITDSIYSDFLAKLKAQGYTALQPSELAAKSDQYKSLDMTENFQTGRWGIYVVPTGQVSISLAADESQALGHGSKSGVFGGFKGNSQRMKKGEADKVLPEVSKTNGTPLIGVTYVVSFADFKSNGYSHWGQSAKTKIDPGATINGFEGKGLDPMATGIQLWDKDTNCMGCPPATLALKGNLHSDAGIGEMAKYDAKTASERTTNALGMALTGDNVKHKAYMMTIDAPAYEKETKALSAKATDLMIAAVVKEK